MFEEMQRQGKKVAFFEYNQGAVDNGRGFSPQPEPKSTAHRARKYQKAFERHSFAAYLILKAAFIRFF
ncbi:MAG: hypothetical protein ACOCNJ_05170, partial [Bacteroidales bacterium]